jgi:hypothetical protein
MKPAFPIILAAFASAGIATTAGAESVVRFANDDRLAGSLESLSSDALLWNSRTLEKPVSFLLEKVVDLSLPAEVPDVSADHEATLTLTNGDTVRGQLASVTDEVVSLDTWFAGRMNFNRLMVSGVRIEGKSSMHYRGPTGLDGWTQSADPPAWTYARSAFRSHSEGSIARDGLLPDECSVTFDVAWRSDSISLNVILFSNNADTDSPGSGYQLSFQRTSIYLRNGRTHRSIGSGAYSRALSENDKVKVEIRASRTSGKVCLFINDRVVKIWTDPDVGKQHFGSCLHFISQNSLPMRISGIGVSSWNGVIDQWPEPRAGLMRGFGLRRQVEDFQPETPEKPGEPRMELANGDSLEGEVTSIKDGRILMKTPLGDISIPVARLRTVALKKVDLEKAKIRNGEIRAWFPDGGSIVFRLDSVGDGTLTGYTQNFGTATFKMSAFSRIEFNIHNPELDDKRSNDEW